jgi:hypothetical protein
MNKLANIKYFGSVNVCQIGSVYEYLPPFIKKKKTFFNVELCLIDKNIDRILVWDIYIFYLLLPPGISYGFCLT